MINSLNIELNVIYDEVCEEHIALDIFNRILNKYSTEGYITFCEKDAFKPYSHYVHKDREKLIWRINTLTKEAKENVILPIMRKLPEKITIENPKAEIVVVDKALEQLSYENLMYKNCLSEQGYSFITIKFKSPTIFEFRGKYKMFPDVDLIYAYLIEKYNFFSRDYEINDYDIFDEIMENTDIIDYDLKTTRFELNGCKIPAFEGCMKIRIKGRIANKNVVNLLFDFSKYSSIGSNTHLGMGGIDINFRWI